MSAQRRLNYALRMRRRTVVVVAIFAAGMAAASAKALTPSDPLATTWTYEAIDLPAAWELTTGSDRVAIAVVDSGVDPTHEDLAGAVLRGYDFVDDDQDAADSNGHGTAVAGIAAARANNGLGAVGVCWSCTILPLRVTRPDGFALYETQARAIEYAVEHGAAVINVSLYGEDRNSHLHEAIRRARASGVPVVAAAGNEGSTLVEYPAAFPETISVGATDERNVLASYSSRGEWVKLAAPGCSPTTQLGGGFGTGCGTSGATPLVAGVAALLRSRAPFATVGEIEEALGRTARPVPGVRFGLVDAAAALRELGSPKPHLEPFVEGEARLGETLVAYSGVWGGAGLQVSVRWERCRTGGSCDAAGDGPTHAIGKADTDHMLRAVLNAPGVEAATSPLTPLIPAAPRNANRPTISGRPLVGSMLTAGRGTWTGTSLAFDYRWIRCDGACRKGAIVGWSRRYRIRVTDRGHRLRLEVSAVNSTGRSTATSRPTRRIR